MGLVECHHSIRIEVITPGDGKTWAKKGDKITIHYTGYLAETGEKFDSSFDRRNGEVYTFPMGMGFVIKGLGMALSQISMGEKAMVTIPAQLAYGAKGSGKKIPPNADLKFEVEVF